MSSPLAVVFGPTLRLHLPVLGVVLATLLVACAPAASVLGRGPTDTGVRLESLEDRAQSWHVPPPAEDMRGLRLLYDTPVPGRPTLAVLRSAVRANHRLDPFDALVLVTHAVALAREHHMAYGFFCATLLQESGFDPRAVSPAGAIGIAQFTLDTADGEGVDPFDWADAMRGSAALLGRYVNAYDGVYPDPYAAALAAYDAGPGAVERYRGIPPYAETRDYIGDIYDRWSRIDRDAARGARGARLPAARAGGGRSGRAP